jgi:DNA polymerase I-like protein with 3'-5' exonuclease and polymerase domains
LVGYDAKGLEMRMFAHYLGNRDAAELYINGDPHQVNADLLGITRSVVKNVFYAFLYGAQDPKLGATGGYDKAWGKQARAKLRKGTPGLDRLVTQIQAEYEDGGWIRCIDGGFVRCPSPHAALNYKLQSAGGIVMKQASIFIDREVQRRGIDALKVNDVHDEAQFDCDRRQAEEMGKLAVQCLRDAGEELKFTVPLDGDYKIGDSWATTH